MTTVTFTASGTWTSPAGVISVNCQCWAEGGHGGTGLTGGSSHSGGGGGGGEFAGESALVVTPSTGYPFTIGSGGSTTNTVFAGDAVTVTAHFGTSTTGSSHGNGGSGSTNGSHFSGGAGGNGITASNPAGGGGGGGAGSSGTGGSGSNGNSNGTGATGGTAGTPDGGAGGKGGNGNTTGNPGTDGTLPGGGGGGGSGRTGGIIAGDGAGGQVSLTYTALQSGTATLTGIGTLTAFGGPAMNATLTGIGTLQAVRSGGGNATLAGVGTLAAHATQQTKAIALTGVGTMSALGGPPTPTVVNQWANNYGQGTAFGSISSSLQSCVVPLNSDFSVGIGSGTATEGNWLFAIASWTQDPAISNAHVGTSDDIHSWWRQYPASSGSTGNVRTAISYTPNTAREVNYVYVAPDAAVAAINVLVVEVSGLQPWDVVTGPTSNYTASGTSLAMSLSAPPQASFWIGAIGGNNASSGQTFAPANYTTLVTLTQSNGVNTDDDNILTSAFRANSNASQSVSGSASTESMSGFMLGVEVAAASPIPVTQNPNWPYTKFEVAFGAGFNTPNSELTWTDLTNRLWSWDETSGIQFQLGQLQATNLLMEIDNFDGALTPVPDPWSFTATGTPSTHSFFTVTTTQAASIAIADGFTDTLNPGTFFTVTNIGAPSGGNVNISFTPAATTIMSSTDVVSQANFAAGVPIRLRMALGGMGGSTINRWYVIQRNVHQWDEEVNATYRRWCNITGTDIWSALSAIAPTFYRSEIYEDNPYAWWPMDDQPLEGGVLPVTLLNAAPGNTNVLEINADPGGVTVQDTYGFNGTDITATILSGGFFTPTETTPPAGSIATYATGANTGWMYGDQPSTTSAISSAGNPVEAVPGSASWQQGGLLGSTGSNGWYLICNDNSFPGLSGGITVKGWFNVGLQGSGGGYAYYDNFGGSWHDTSLAGQPFTSITICELATASHPVAVLQLDSSGHLNLITYNGSTGTSHSVYSSSDLRNGTWIAVDMTFTTTTWEVMLNGGITADASGSATGMTSAWTYLILCGDFGSSGGSSPGDLVHGGNMSLSHWTVFPYILPDWRILAHYTAAISGFGLLPAPIGAGISPTSSPPTDQAQSITGPSAADDAAYQTTPDGSEYTGGYGQSGDSPTSYSYSLVVTTNAGSYSSGPSARTVNSGIGQVILHTPSPGTTYHTWGYALWLSWLGVAPGFNVYTSAAASTEKLLENTIANGNTVTSGFGSGAAPPTTATALGDTVQQRIERLMKAGKTTTPQRSIDPAPDLVQAPGVSGSGVQASSAVQAIQQSDNGMLFVDNPGNIVYWMRDHLASQYANPVWTIGPDTSSGQIPYYRDYRLVNDPQRIYNVITVQPFSPTGAQLPLLTPSDATGVANSQLNYGAQGLQITSWLQDQTVMQAQADWLFANFGQPQTRAEEIRIDAAPYPLAWELFCGINVGDVILLEEWEIGGGGEQLTLRVTEINRKFRFGGMDEGNHGEGTVVASVTLTCDFEPASYF